MDTEKSNIKKEYITDIKSIPTLIFGITWVIVPFIIAFVFEKYFVNKIVTTYAICIIAIIIWMCGSILVFFYSCMIIPELKKNIGEKIIITLNDDCTIKELKNYIDTYFANKTNNDSCKYNIKENTLTICNYY